MKRKTTILTTSILVFLTALGITLYPIISNYVNQKYASKIYTEYEEMIQNVDDALFQEPPPRRRFWLAGRSFPIIVMRILKVRFKALPARKLPSERILTSTHIFSG